MADRRALDLDSLAISDRFRLFNFTTGREDPVAFLWVLRAMDRLREVHRVQVDAGEVQAALNELARLHDEVPTFDGKLRDRLDALYEDGVVHRFDDASRAGNLVRYRNRQSVYQFSELGYWAYTSVEGLLAARIQDANLSRLVFSDILEDLKALAAANRAGEGEQVYRRLSRLDSVMEDMGRRSAHFHVTLGEIIRSTDASPETFLRYKNALLTHMSEFMAELDRYLPRLATAVRDVEASGLASLLDRAAAADERPFMDRDERLEDWRRRWSVLRAWFAPQGSQESRAGELRNATRIAVSGVIALLRQISEAQRGGVNRATQLRHLAEWVWNAPDEGAAHALMGAAFNLRTARHLGAAHEDTEQISPRATWWDAPGVEVSVTLFRSGKAPTPGVPTPVRGNSGARAALRREQAAERAAERERRPPDGAGRARAGARRVGDPDPAETDDAGAGGTHGRRRPPEERLRRQRRRDDPARAVRHRKRRAHRAGTAPSARVPGRARRADAGDRFEYRGCQVTSSRLRVAVGVPAADLGSYQQAVRRVLTCDLITKERPRPGVLDQVLRWADEMARDFRELLGYTLIATTHHVRLVRRLDVLDDTQRSIFSRKGKPFDRRRMAYLCLVLGSFQRSRIEISLADLVRIFTPLANSIDGLGFDPAIGSHKAAIVDVLGWLVDRGALRLSDGSLEWWARDSERGDALYDIDHDICAVLFKPARPVQHLTSAAGLVHEPPHSNPARRARRLLVEFPVVYYADVEPEVADALRAPGLAEDLVRFTGLVLERRAEGVMLADPGGVFTDRPFPGRGNAVSRAAGLLLAKIADLLEDPEHVPEPLPVPALADDQADLVARMDAGLPATASSPSSPGLRPSPSRPPTIGPHPPRRRSWSALASRR